MPSIVSVRSKAEAQAARAATATAAQGLKELDLAVTPMRIKHLYGISPKEMGGASALNKQAAVGSQPARPGPQRDRTNERVQRLTHASEEPVEGAKIVGVCCRRVQQQRQDDHIYAIEKHMEYNDQRLDEFRRQHDIMERQLEDLKRYHEEDKPKRRK